MSDRKPNILFFFTDDQRWNTIRALGNAQIHTPTLDALVGRGCVFENGYIMGGSCPAVCMPSRAMLMTGRTLYRIERQGQEVPEDHALLGETLRQAGYRTFGTGKWHNGARAYARSFTDGDEIFFGGMSDHWNVPAHHFDPSGKYESRIPWCPNPGGSNEVRHRHCDHIPSGKHSTELFADACIDFINDCDEGEPFFMYCSFMAPHDPRTMPKKFLDMYDPEEIELPPNFLGGHPFDNGELWIRDEQLEKWPRTPEAIRRHLAEYYAMISHIDAEMKRVIDTLDEQGRLEDTIIVFAGDNGLALGQHGLMGKQSCYEHSVHVPFLMAGPGVPAGERRQAFCYLIDIFPTLCDLTGTTVPESVEGRSLVPALRDESERVRDTLHFAYRQFQRAVRDERFKLIEYFVNGRRTTQLFDLQSDPWERKNLAADPAHADTVARLGKELQRWRTEYGDTSEQGEAFWSGMGPA